eukprot:CAMPEP_0115069296 /NCGR_PEP_ID=MMETSP0227-20121206/12477_1 /TAXON_ID=89957 /ORGANISM="Polarella glacialis, Strain CCMP 1383" /LENGTH=271 /DNA_ID=CAMNT_0002455679 /DNA_START=412 /DNA_END=1225 /DNA_ORIENTATION=-
MRRRTPEGNRFVGKQQQQQPQQQQQHQQQPWQQWGDDLGLQGSPLGSATPQPITTSSSRKLSAFNSLESWATTSLSSSVSRAASTTTTATSATTTTATTTPPPAFRRFGRTRARRKTSSTDGEETQSMGDKLDGVSQRLDRMELLLSSCRFEHLAEQIRRIKQILIPPEKAEQPDEASAAPVSKQLSFSWEADGEGCADERSDSRDIQLLVARPVTVTHFEYPKLQHLKGVARFFDIGDSEDECCTPGMAPSEDVMDHQHQQQQQQQQQQQ